MNTRHIAEEYRLSRWAEILRERKESGLSVRAYCEHAGFHENKYYYWQKKLREAACEELIRSPGNEMTMMSAGFVELKLPTQRLLPQAAAVHHSQVCVEVSGVRITAAGEYPVDKLAMLLRVVTQPC